MPALRKSPNPDALATRGDVAGLELACRRAPSDVRLRLLLGHVQRGRGHVAMAAGAFREAAELRPDLALPRLHLAATLLDAGHRDQARQALAPLVEKPGPLESGPALARGLARLLQGRPAEVRRTVRGSKRGRPSLDEAVLLAAAEPDEAARILKTSGEPAGRELSELHRALRTPGARPDAFSKARKHLDQGNPEAALRLLPEHSVDRAVLRARALALQAAGRPEEAGDAWARLAEGWDSPLAPYAWWRAGRLLREAGCSDAADCLQRALESLPDRDDLRREAVDACLTARERKEASRLLEPLLHRESPAASDLILAVGTASGPDAVADLLERAVRAAPDDETIHEQAADLLMTIAENSDLTDARELVVRARKLLPRHPRIQLLDADVSLAGGDRARARTLFVEMARSAPFPLACEAMEMAGREPALGREAVKAAAARPNLDPEERVVLGCFQARSGLRAEAQATLAGVAAHPAAPLLEGWIQAAAGHQAKARKALAALTGSMALHPMALLLEDRLEGPFPTTVEEMLLYLMSHGSEAFLRRAEARRMRMDDEMREMVETFGSIRFVDLPRGPKPRRRKKGGRR